MVWIVENQVDAEILHRSETFQDPNSARKIVKKTFKKR